MGKARQVKKYKELATRVTEAIQIETAPWTKADAYIRFYYPCRRKRDGDNAVASLKAAFDGIVDAGLLDGDHAEVLTVHPPEMLIDKNHPHVQILIVRNEETEPAKK